MSESTYWLLSTLIWTAIMSFYSMQEMACISCNKLRLDYAVAQKERWALWLQKLLERPSVLFSTTLIGVNFALMVSAESSRRLFEAWGLDPSYAPLAEIPFVLIFGELIPMFAARLNPDSSCRFGVPLLYASAKILMPFIYAIGAFFRYTSMLLGKKEKKEIAPFLSRDELQKLLEEHQAGYLGDHEAPVDEMIGNIFSMRNKRAYQLMQRLDTIPRVFTHTTVGELRELCKKNSETFYPVYHRKRQKIIGYVYLQDVLNETDNKRIDEYTEPAYFVTLDMQALDLLRKMQEEKVDAAIAINAQGVARGIIYVEDLIDELFGAAAEKPAPAISYFEKTVPADTKISDFNEAFGTNIDPQGCKTFAELVEKVLEHRPHPQDTIFVDPFELVVKETTLFKAKTIQIKTA